LKPPFSLAQLLADNGTIVLQFGGFFAEPLDWNFILEKAVDHSGHGEQREASLKRDSGKTRTYRGLFDYPLGGLRISRNVTVDFAKA